MLASYLATVVDERGSHTTGPHDGWDDRIFSFGVSCYFLCWTVAACHVARTMFTVMIFTVSVVV